MTNKEISQLSSTLNRCTFKTLGDQLFLPMIEFIGALNIANDAYEKKQKDIVKHLGLNINAAGNIAVTDTVMADKLNNAFTELGNETVSVDGLELGINDFKCLSDENPSIIASDLLLIKKYLIKIN